jgi:hypothetical protein
VLFAAGNMMSNGSQISVAKGTVVQLLELRLRRRSIQKQAVRRRPIFGAHKRSPTPIASVLTGKQRFR